MMQSNPHLRDMQSNPYFMGTFNFWQNPQAVNPQAVYEQPCYVANPGYESQLVPYLRNLSQQNQKLFQQMEANKVCFTLQEVQFLNQSSPLIMQKIAKLQEELRQSTSGVKEYQEQVELYKAQQQKALAEMEQLRTVLQKVRLEALEKAKYHAEVQQLQTQVQKLQTELQACQTELRQAEVLRAQQAKAEYKTERENYQKQADCLRKELRQLQEGEQRWVAYVRRLMHNNQVEKMRLRYLVEKQQLIGKESHVVKGSHRHRQRFNRPKNMS